MKIAMGFNFISRDMNKKDIHFCSLNFISVSGKFLFPCATKIGAFLSSFNKALFLIETNQCFFSHADFTQTQTFGRIDSKRVESQARVPEA
jgi:hypothetical protein